MLFGIALMEVVCFILPPNSHRDKTSVVEMHWADEVDPDISHATRQLVRLLRTLGELGFQTEVRHGDKSSLLVFVRAPEDSLHRAVHTSRYVQTSGIHPLQMGREVK